MATIAEVLHATMERLRDAAGEDARLEAEVLLAHALSIDRAHLLARLQDELPANTNTVFEALVERRSAREPLAYIVGYREFYGIDVICTPAVLIPRPETEMLVDFALEEIARRGPTIVIADVGTGSGAVAVAVAVNAPDVRVTATDASVDALDVAERNARKHSVAERVAVRRTDLLEGLGRFDLVLANLPYVSEAEWDALQPEIRGHEPRAALVGGPHGTEVIERLISQAPTQLAAGGVLAAEIGETQGEALLAIARRSFPDAQSYVMKDFAGRDRILMIRRKGEGIG